MKVGAIKKLWAYRVLKKLWGYIKRKRNRLAIQVKIEVENEKKQNVAETLEVEVQCIAKGEVIDSFTASAKLRRFKATEPEI